MTDLGLRQEKPTSVRSWSSRLRDTGGWIAGCVTGLLLGIAGLSVLWYGSARGNAEQMQRFERRLQALATHGGDSLAIATGPIDEGAEGIFFLDYVTGELTCQVLNPRTGLLGGVFRQNVVNDLGIEPGKQPKYLITIGALDVRPNISNIRPARSIVYVADSNTGRYVAYALPWNQQIANAGGAQVSPMLAIGRGAARNIILE